MLHKLRVLPGPHQGHVQDFFDPSKNKETAALGIIKSFQEFNVPEEDLTDGKKKERAETALRISKLEICTKEDLARLQEDLKRAEFILKQTVSGSIQKGAKTAEAPKKLGTIEGKESHGGLVSLAEAKEIIGPLDFLGPEQIRQSLGVELKEIPSIPFTKQELEKAKAEGFQLILRVDKDANSQPLTMKRLSEIFTPRFASQQKGKVFYKADRFQNEDFFIAETPRTGWVLQQKDFLPNSAGKNYLEQTQLILDYLKTQKFSDAVKEKQRQDAISEAESLLPEITALDISKDWQEVAQRLSALKINNYRRSPAEVVFDHIIFLDVTNTRLFNGQAKYDWTKSSSSSGYLVRVGHGGAYGLFVDGWEPGNHGDDMGVSLSI